MLTLKERSHLKKTIPAEERLPLLFSALGDPRRFQMFRILAVHCNACVTDIAALFGISLPAASQQLTILARAGLIAKEREGKTTCYHIRRKDSTVAALIHLMRTKE